MSSESSVSTSDSSRIRQFGLYRTIDARTEEFLRQSRKRQIKQGCACATISTAITVTVVIVVILIYMKNGPSSDTYKKIGRSSWIGLINDSLPSQFEEKLRNTKFSFDRTTIKLLPLLIETLKQNKYLEKIIDDYSSSSPAYEGRVTTEYELKKNIFADPKNWLKSPVSRLYAIEYKTSPFVYFKKPTTKLAYFTKTKKISGYKNILRHVSKMPDEKTEKVLPLPTEKYISIMQKPPKFVPVTPTEGTSPIIDQHNLPKIDTSEQQDFVSCKCPTSQLSILLDKIFSSFRPLLVKEVTTLEADSKPTTISSKKILKSKMSPIHFSEFNNVFQYQDTDTPTSSIDFKTIIGKESTTMSVANLNFYTNRHDTSQSSDLSSKEVDIDEVVSTIKETIEPTEIEVTLSSTQPMMSAQDYVSKDYERKTEESSTIVYSNFVESQTRRNNPKDFEKYDSYSKAEEDVVDPIFDYHKDLTSTSQKPTTTDKFSEFDKYSLELFKPTLLPMDRHLNSTKNFTSHITLQNNTTQFSEKRNAAYTIPVVKEVSINKEKEPFVTSSWSYGSSTETINSYPEVSTKPPNIQLDLKTILNLIKLKLTERKQNRFHKLDDTIKEYDEVNKEIHDENYHEDYREKPNESMSPPSVVVSNNTVVGPDLSTNMQKDDVWSFLNANFDRSKMRSMLPLNRPTYLEIQRHNWKTEDNENYDLNIKNDIYDQL